MTGPTLQADRNRPEPGTGVTRLAPSPTGALHLGNARTFLINWCVARASNWRIILRVEDLDTPRVKPETIAQTIETLRWLGLDWDEGPLLQSDDLTPYREAMHSLARSGMVYPCELTRSQIEAAASAPNEGEHETRFDPSLRPNTRPTVFETSESNWRLMVEPGQASFADRFRGPTSVEVSESVGDFVVWTRRGTPSYQLAVVVDDARQGVTEVVRADDLLDSAGRQLLLYRALGLGTPPSYTHVPLVRGMDGRRLAKRHGDTRIDLYRSRGVPPERVVGLLAHWCGVVSEPEPIAAADLIERVRLDTIPDEDITFRPENDAWLLRS